MADPRVRFKPGAIRYDEGAAACYREGRALSRETAVVWRETIRPFIPLPSRIVDVGAGTGRFSQLLARFPGAEVIAVEPSLSMLRIATAAISGTIACVAGSAERIPLLDRSTDVAWLSQVFHHIRDRRACTRELRRIVRPRGCVLVRGTFADRP